MKSFLVFLVLLIGLFTNHSFAADCKQQLDSFKRLKEADQGVSLNAQEAVSHSVWIHVMIKELTRAISIQEAATAYAANPEGSVPHLRLLTLFYETHLKDQGLTLLDVSRNLLKLELCLDEDVLTLQKSLQWKEIAAQVLQQFEEAN